MNTFNDSQVELSHSDSKELIQSLADLLDEAMHQLWHAVHDPESFDRDVAASAYEDIKKRGHEAVASAFKEVGKR